MTNLYSDYWKRKELLKSQVPNFSVIKYFNSPKLCPIEKIYFDSLKGATNILDFGAGDLRAMKKIQASGYTGVYETLDVAEGITYTYRSLGEVNKTFDAIICLDVLEHLPLNEGLSLLHNFFQILNPGGILILQTPNARCVRHPLSWDMTHVQCYNGPDLWAYLTSLNFKVTGFRVVFSSSKISFLTLMKNTISRLIITKCLGLDYADNIAMLARK